MGSVIPSLDINEKLNAVIFEGHNVPALIVEGDTDLRIYCRLFLKCSVNFSKIDLVVAKGKKELLKYHNEGLPFKYVGLLDADYDRYKNCCLESENLVYTHFYTMENYLIQEEVIQNTLLDFSNIFTINVTCHEIISEAIDSIRSLMTACLAKVDNQLDIKLEGFNIERWWDKSTGRVSEEKIRDYVIEECGIAGNTWEQCFNQAKEKLRTIASESRLGLIVNGKHMLCAVFYRFKTHFPDQMKKRDQSVFALDLCKNIFYSDMANDLASELERKLNRLIA